jgi:CRISPR-associated protein Csd1
LIETAVLRKTENISPQLAGEWLRSILTGQRYPRQVLTQLVQRLRSDGDVNGLRAALIKAVLHRDHRKGFTKEAIPMSLELENAPLAYRLGCLFAVLEQAQRGALGDVNSSIVDRYYGTASSVPYSVFPRLIAGCQNHLSKIRKDKPGFAVNLDKQLGGVIASLPHSFPKQLTIEQQGQFAVGYYHQKQNFFTKKDSVPSATTTPSN